MAYNWGFDVQSHVMLTLICLMKADSFGGLVLIFLHTIDCFETDCRRRVAEREFVPSSHTAIQLRMKLKWCEKMSNFKHIYTT